MITSAVAVSIQAVSPGSIFACAISAGAPMSCAHRRHGAVVDLAGAYSDRAHERHHEDLAVADLAGSRALAERVDGRLDEVLRHRDLAADLVGEAHLHGRAAVGLDTLELAAVTLHAADRDTSYLGPVERLQHVVDLLRPDDADHELHGPAPFASAHSSAPAAAYVLPRGAIASPQGRRESYLSRRLCGRYPTRASARSSAG